MQTTCGIFIFNPDGKILICHPTGNKKDNGWSIPKGKPNKDEALIDAAIRETREETGLDLSDKASGIRFVSEAIYKSNKKRLMAFIFRSDSQFEVSDLKCLSCTDNTDVPEIDKFDFVSTKEAMTRLHESQVRVLKDFLQDKKDVA